MKITSSWVLVSVQGKFLPWITLTYSSQQRKSIKVLPCRLWPGWHLRFQTVCWGWVPDYRVVPVKYSDILVYRTFRNLHEGWRYRKYRSQFRMLLDEISGITSNSNILFYSPFVFRKSFSPLIMLDLNDHFRLLYPILFFTQNSKWTP